MGHSPVPGSEAGLGALDADDASRRAATAQLHVEILSPLVILPSFRQPPEGPVP
jgi:hypothetical protein